MITKKAVKIKIEQLHLKKNENYILSLKNKKEFNLDKRTIGKNLFNKNSVSFLLETKFSSVLSLSSYSKSSVLTDYLSKRKKLFHEIILLKWNQHLLTPQQGLSISPGFLFVRLKNLTEPQKKFCFIIRQHLAA